MKFYLFLIILFLSIIPCSKKQSEELPIFTNLKDTVLNIQEIRKSDLNKSEKFDTLLSNQQLHISIKKSKSNTHVISEYFDENIAKAFLKYDNNEISVVIKHKSKVVLDTIFKKENFLEILDQNFFNVAVLYEYQFSKIANDSIVFYGSIQKPDPDWIVRFNHHYDLKTNTFSIEELDEDED